MTLQLAELSKVFVLEGVEDVVEVEEDAWRDGYRLYQGEKQRGIIIAN